eukprot:14749526-Ditylum_brightwellii.AAC.2
MKKEYVVLLRGESDSALESVHLRNHTHYHKEVYQPCLTNIRQCMHGYVNEEEEDVPDESISVEWNDGDVNQ